VEEASQYGLSYTKRVSLPSTVNEKGGTDANGWRWAPLAHIVLKKSSNVRTVLPGQIIQMNWKNKSGSMFPHTAIVGDVSPLLVTLIDSNWSHPKHPGEHNWVQKRIITWTELEKGVGTEFTIYEIQ
jgi:hypothetical protein